MMIKLRSGKEFYANCGIIGIAPKENNYFILTEGYDGDIFLRELNEDGNGYRPRFTREELLELSDMMIDRWEQFQFDIGSERIPCIEKEIK
jgi:hypothetical protein